MSDVDLALFEVLSLLRQAGPPYCLSPKELTRLSPVSASAISLRLGRLEERGLIRRSSGQDGYKGVRVWLTPQGQQLIDETMPVRQALHDRLVEVMTVQEQASLHSMLLTLAAQVNHHESRADNHGPNRGLAP